MNTSINCMKLDFLLLKPYLKSMLLVLLVPLLFPFFTGTLFEGLSFAATVMAMTTGYTFSVAEKNNLDRFYGFLPVKKVSLVIGRYMLVFLMGFAVLLFAVTVQTMILNAMGAVQTSETVLESFLICAGLFCIYAAVQIPGYYRFGSIKGKMFMFIPTVGFLLAYAFIKMLGSNSGSLITPVLPNQTVLVASAAAGMALVIGLSVFVSAKVVERGSR